MAVKYVHFQTAVSEKVGNMKIPNQIKTKIQVYNEMPAFGKGIFMLLKLVEKHGSLSKAYGEIGMAASKAWKIIRRAEEDLDCKLIESSRGGKEKGKSVLTEDGKEICRRYEKMMAEINTAAENAFAKYFLEK